MEMSEQRSKVSLKNNKIVYQVSLISHTHSSLVKDFIGRDPSSFNNLFSEQNVGKYRCPDYKNQDVLSFA